jgi:hypothetical protein
VQLLLLVVPPLLPLARASPLSRLPCHCQQLRGLQMVVRLLLVRSPR